MLHWLRQFSKRIQNNKLPRLEKRRQRFRPSLEWLEDRAVPAGLQYIQIGSLSYMSILSDGSNMASIAAKVNSVLPQGSFNLDPGFASQSGGSLTNLAAVNISGQTSPGFQVSLLNGPNTTADHNGNFTLTGVPLAPGQNNVSLTFTDHYGYRGVASASILRNAAPIVNQAISNLSVAENAADTLLSIYNTFKDPDALLTNTRIRFDTILGDIDVRLFDSLAPKNVANIIQYINDGDYDNSIFHRLVTGSFGVLQGGGFKYAGDGVLPTAVTSNGNVALEYNVPNTRGILAMARLANQANSANSQWFFNTTDNSAALSPQGSADQIGYTAIGVVINNGMTVVDALAALSVKDLSADNGAFGTIPMVNYSGTSTTYPGDATKANYALIEGISITARADGMTFQIVGNTNSGLVTPTVEHNKLRLDYTNGQVGTSTITLQATDKEGLKTTTSFTVTVNAPPALQSMANQTVNEGSTINVTATATDADSTAAQLTFSLQGTVPAGAAINPTTGAFTWTPTEAQGPGVYTFTVQVKDNTNLNDQKELKITVNEVNQSPSLGGVPAQGVTVNEGSAVSFTATASDADSPANTITFSLQGTVPAGASINGSTGAFSWTPSEEQGPGTYTFTVRATDNGNPNQFDEKNFDVTVNEVNQSPVFGNFPTMTVNGGQYDVDATSVNGFDTFNATEGQQISLAFTATDPDLPANSLTFSIESSDANDFGASIDSVTGLFTLTPTAQQVGNYLIFTVHVSDGTTSIFQTFAVLANAII